jgi:hypothetical protein
MTRIGLCGGRRWLATFASAIRFDHHGTDRYADCLRVVTPAQLQTRSVPAQPHNKRMNRSDLALASFVINYECNPTCRPVILDVRPGHFEDCDSSPMIPGLFSL